MVFDRKPSSFRNYPWDSIFKKSQAEVVAQNIMKILSRKGNEFRELTWEEYVEERKKDGNFNSIEEYYFRMVVHHCQSAEAAVLVSKEWAEDEAE